MSILLIRKDGYVLKPMLFGDEFEKYVKNKLPVTPGSAHGMSTSCINAYWSTDSVEQ